MSAQYFMNENLFFYKNIHVIILQCNGIIFFKIELIGKCINYTDSRLPIYPKPALSHAEQLFLQDSI